MNIRSLSVENENLIAEASEVLSSALDSGQEIAQLGEFVSDSLREHYDVGTFDDLDRKAVRLRCLAERTLLAGSDLARHAGRLEALGKVRRGIQSTEA